ncbi:multidrug resistance efflux transporter family protein [Streptomyces violascens]|uniref:multidrug resistance efflux transporter family protein n=1 Tax=Streptomyces violascens TaxID=67381 RepID=UPI0036483D91
MPRRAASSTSLSFAPGASSPDTIAASSASYATSRSSRRDGSGVGAPGRDQVVQCLIVALVSGVVATTLFFRATDLVRDRPAALGAVEATQAAEVPFTLAGEALLTGVAAPTPPAWTGLALIVTGLCLHALHRPPPEPPATATAWASATPARPEAPAPRSPSARTP